MKFMFKKSSSFFRRDKYKFYVTSHFDKITLKKFLKCKCNNLDSPLHKTMTFFNVLDDEMSNCIY